LYIQHTQWHSAHSISNISDIWLKRKIRFHLVVTASADDGLGIWKKSLSAFLMAFCWEKHSSILGNILPLSSSAAGTARASWNHY
jgi:hypothetical protein